MATKSTAGSKPARAKKPAAKTSPKKTAAKKVAAAPAKKPASKKTSTTKAAPAPRTESFRLSRESQSFISSRITLQTVYWSILAIVILIVGLFILNVQLDILETLDGISEGF